MAASCALGAVLLPMGTARLRPLLENLAAARLELPVAIESVSLGLLPPELRLQTIAIGREPAGHAEAAGAEREQTFVRCAELKLRPHISALLLLRPILARIEASGLEGTVWLPQGSKAANQADSGERQGMPRALRLPLDVHAAKVELGAFAVTWPTDRGQARLGLERARLVLAPARLWRERRLVAEADGIGIEALAGLLPSAWAAERAPARLDGLSLRSVVRTTGPLDQPESLVAEDLHVAGPGLSLAARGQGELWGTDANVTLAGSLTLADRPGSPLVELFAHAAATPSEVALEISTTGDWSSQAGTFALGYIGPARSDFCAMASAQAEGHFTAGEATLTAGALALGEMPRLSWRGTCKRGGVNACRLAMLAEALAVRPLTDALMPGAEVPLEVELTGTAELQASLGPKPACDLNLALSLQPGRWLAGGEQSGQAGSPPDIAAVPGSFLRLRGTANEAGLTIDAGALELGEDTLHFAGLAFARARGKAARGRLSPPRLSLQLWTEGVDLAAFSPIAGLAYSGRLGGAASLTLPAAGPLTVESSLSAESLQIGGRRLGAASGIVRWQDGAIVLDDLDVRRGAGHVVGSLRLGPGGRGGLPLAGQLTLRAVEAHDLLVDLGVPAAACKDLYAPLAGELTLAGTTQAPAGRGLVRTPRLTLFGLRLGAAELAISGKNGSEVLAASLWADATDGSLGADLSVASDHTIAARARVHSLPLAFGWLAAGEPARMDLSLTLDGPIDRLTGHALVELALPRAEGTREPGADPGPSRLHLAMQAEAGRARLSLHGLGEALTGSGTLGLQAGWPLHATVRLHQLTSEALRPLLPMLASTKRDFGLVVSGELGVTGSLVAWPALQGSFALHQLEGRLGLATVKLVAPTRLTLRDGLLSVPAIALSGRNLAASLHGTVRLVGQTAAYQLEGALHGPAAALSPFVPILTAAKGQLRLSLSLGGQARRPKVFGEAEWTGGSLRLPTFDQALEQLNLKLVFSGRALALTVGEARIGRGRASMSGEWALGDGSWLDPHGTLNVRGRLEQVPMRPLPDASLRLTGGFDLSGPPGALKLAGDFRVDAGRYTAKLDFNKLLRKKRAPPLQASFLPFSRPVMLAIKLSAQHDIIISSRVLEAELAGNLTLTGTTERLGLLGSVSPLWARARYRDNLFVIPRATVDFTDEYRIAPVYHIEVKTRACQMDASVLVTGDSEGYQLSASGRDDRGVVDQQDVLSCLHLGVRLSDFSGKTAGYADALTGSFDALWTVSGLDEKVRRFLPIRVDELRLTSAWSSVNQRTTPRLIVGRDLGGHLALRYSRAIATDEVSDQSLTIDYRMQRNKTLQAGYMSARDVGLGDFGLDLRLHWELR